MARGPKPPVEALEVALGHVFKERDLLKYALTHVSAINGPKRNESYQRLEFLGDRVLGMAVSAMLYEAFPRSDEGELSRRLAALVRKETCAEVAREWDVGAHIRLGAGEAHSGGRNKTAILGDVCEALIGAVYLDGGYEAARQLVQRSFGSRMKEEQRPLQDSKTKLQEWAQARGLPPPAYREVNRSGPAHAPEFDVGVVVEGFDVVSARGSSKRFAEQAAALAFLIKEGVVPKDAHGTEIEA
jgi:ribonuclease-3